jgi:hypothetical protein
MGPTMDCRGLFLPPEIRLIPTGPGQVGSASRFGWWLRAGGFGWSLLEDRARGPLALPDPGHDWLALPVRLLVLAIAPGAARAVIMPLAAAGRTDHEPNYAQ